MVERIKWMPRLLAMALVGLGVPVLGGFFGYSAVIFAAELAGSTPEEAPAPPKKPPVKTISVHGGVTRITGDNAEAPTSDAVKAPTKPPAKKTTAPKIVSNVQEGSAEGEVFMPEVKAPVRPVVSGVRQKRVLPGAVAPPPASTTVVKAGKTVLLPSTGPARPLGKRVVEIKPTFPPSAAAEGVVEPPAPAPEKAAEPAAPEPSDAGEQTKDAGSPSEFSAPPDVAAPVEGAVEMAPPPRPAGQAATPSNIEPDAGTTAQGGDMGGDANNDEYYGYAPGFQGGYYAPYGYNPYGYYQPYYRPYYRPYGYYNYYRPMPGYGYYGY